MIRRPVYRLLITINYVVILLVDNVHLIVELIYSDGGIGRRPTSSSGFGKLMPAPPNMMQSDAMNLLLGGDVNSISRGAFDSVMNGASFSLPNTNWNLSNSVSFGSSEFHDLSLCPICKQQRKNDTALSVSGFVFCYKCIFQYLKRHGMCPITRIPAKVQNLVCLYDKEI
jgi:hypothetical protein